MTKPTKTNGAGNGGEMRVYPIEVRRRAETLLKDGKKVPQVAKIMKLKESTIYRWQHLMWVAQGKIRKIPRDNVKAAKVLKRARPRKIVTVKAGSTDFARGVAFGHALGKMQTLIVDYSHDPERLTREGMDVFATQMSLLLSPLISQRK